MRRVDDADLLVDLGKRGNDGDTIKHHRGAGMSWEDQRLRREREQLVQAVVENRSSRSRFMLISPQVRIPHACRKEGIPCKEDAVVEQIAGTLCCMSRCMQSGERDVGGHRGIAITDHRERKRDTLLIWQK